MKKLATAFLILVAASWMFSCNKDDDNQDEKIPAEIIVGRWLINNTSTYNIIEFTAGGNYLIVKHTSIETRHDPYFFFGIYEFTDNQTLLLPEFGTLEILDIHTNSADFSMLPNGTSSGESVHAIKQDEMDNTPRTSLLCRTWKMVSVNGQDVAGTENDLSVLYTRAGTYFVDKLTGEDHVASWKWKDDTETQIMFSTYIPPEWHPDDVVEVTELTSSTLTITEEYDSGETYIYTLKATDIINQE